MGVFGMRFCPKCGTSYSDKYRFCKQCGTSLIVKNNNNGKVQQSVNKVQQPVKSENNNMVWLVIIAVILAVAGVGVLYYKNEVESLKNQVKNQETLSETKQKSLETVIENQKKQLRSQETALANSVDEIKRLNNAKREAETYSYSYSTNRGIITGTDVYMRAGPGKQYRTLGFFYKGQVVEIISFRSGWINVRLASGDSVWVSDMYCKRL